MRFEPATLVKEYRAAADNRFHSQYQFDHVYRFLHRWLQRPDESSEKEAALWLTSLLAHWGMFRASSRIKDRNVLFFRDLLIFAARGKKAALGPLIGLPFDKLTTVGAVRIDQCFDELGDWLGKHEVTPTDTLLTKIALGLTCHIPAYDRNFKQGLKVLADLGQYQGKKAFGGQGLHDLANWAAGIQWPKVRSQADGRSYLPLARVVDMAVFQLGKNDLGKE